MNKTTTGALGTTGMMNQSNRKKTPPKEGVEDLIETFKPLTEKEEILMRIAYKSGIIEGLRF